MAEAAEGRKVGPPRAAVDGGDEEIARPARDDASAVSDGFDDELIGRAAGSRGGPGEAVGAGAKICGDDVANERGVVEEELAVDEADGAVEGV